MRKQSADISKIIKDQAESILCIPQNNPYQDALDILHQAGKRHGRVVVSGVGKAGDVGRKIVSTFNSTGVSSIFLSALDAAHGDLGVLKENDALLLISNSGKTREILELLALAKKFHSKIKTICITGDPKSPLGRTVDVVLSTGNPKEVCPLGLTPTTSVIVMLAIANVLTVLSMHARKFTAKDYSLRHHGGYLGKRAKHISKKK